MKNTKGCEMLIFLDLETTGLDSFDKICSIAIVSDEETHYDLVNEGKKIPPLASSINHITNEMIKDKVSLKDSDTFQYLQKNNNSNIVLVGHNIKFDLQKLNEIGFFFEGRVIDTLRVTKHLIKECEFFSLQFLRYELRLYKQESQNIVPHHALSDALVVKNLYQYLTDIASIDEMCELSLKKVLIEKFSFGKYAGKYIEEVSVNDRGYLEWMLANIMDLDEDLRYSIEYNIAR
ncbi:MAG: exonuclease domain-containing protein [Campylobacterota bacterium]|nr:exonuclease domain-containing protein [Campylobacterota bacterium]